MENYDEMLKKVSAAFAEKGAESPQTDEATEDKSASSTERIPSEGMGSSAQIESNTGESINSTDEGYADDEDTEQEEISLSGWLWRLCIPVIPCVGIFAYLIMLCIWTFGSKPAPSYFRTWAKAALIATVIQIAFFLVILLAVQLSGMDIIGLVATFLKKAL